MDRWDAVEFAGLALVALAIGFVFWPAGLAVAGLALIVESQLRSLARGPRTEAEEAPE